MPEYWRKGEKLTFLKERASIASIEWQELLPDEKNTWITENLRPEFARFLPIGIKDAKTEHNQLTKAIFAAFLPGVLSGRDSIVYSFEYDKLITRIEQFFEDYNSEVSRWIRAGCPKDIDNFVRYDKIKWSEHLKNELKRKKYGLLNKANFRASIYRPFCKKWLYYDSILNDRPSSFDKIFPVINTPNENSVIWLKVGSEWPMFALVTNVIPDYLPQGGTSCFPYYIYNENGSNRHENITDWALSQFQVKYGIDVNKRDIFHYLYAILYHPKYREFYAQNLKRELPRIPTLKDQTAFDTCVRIGTLLMHLHLNYEQVAEYPLTWVENKDMPISYHVEKMKLTSSKDALVVNQWLTLAGIPQECFQYRLGNRSALEWVVDQYQISTDARSGLTSDPNRLDDEQYIVSLIGRIVTVSIETVKLVNELAKGVTQDDWMSEITTESATHSMVQSIE